MTNKDIIRKTLELIELYACNIASDNEEGEIGNIYLWAHTALHPGCRKNHPQWMEDLMESIRKMNNG